MLRTIAEAAKQGATPDMIDATLKARFPIEGIIQQQQPAAAQQQDAAAIRAALSDLVRQAVREETNEIMAELVELRAEVQRLTAALSAGQQQGPQEAQPPAAPQLEASEPPTEAAPLAVVEQPARRPSWWERIVTAIRGK